MPAKISKEVRQRIHELREESKPVREILSILKSEGVKISDKSIYNIIKENEQNKVKNQSFVSIEVDEEDKTDENLNTSFDESFGEEDKSLPTLTRENKEELFKEIKQENNINFENLHNLINEGIKQGTEQVLSKLNKDISESNDKLDEIINETKKTIISKQTPTDHSI